MKENSDGIIVYIFNNNAEPGMFDLKFNRECAGVYRYDASADAYAEISMENGSCSYAVDGFDAVILEFRKEAISCPKYKIPENLKRREYAFETAPEWDYTPPGDGWLAAMHRWNIRIAGEHVSKEVNAQSFSLVRDIVGTELPHMKNQRPRPIFDRSPTIASIYPLIVEFSADFSLRLKPLRKICCWFLKVILSAAVYRLFINDESKISMKLKECWFTMPGTWLQMSRLFVFPGKISSALFGNMPANLMDCEVRSTSRRNRNL